MCHAAIESAARASQRVDFANGATIIREGEIGDCFYVIDSGKVEVSREGVPIRSLGPGSSFGEIALIRQVPRTASVLAAPDAEVLALSRADFLLAVCATPKALLEVNRVVGGYGDVDDLLG